MNPNMLPAFFSSSWATFVLGRAEWSFLSAGDLALPNLIPAFAEDDNIGLFFSSCREGERATCSFEGACSWGEI
jgi:hypothetical protein